MSDCKKLDPFVTPYVDGQLDAAGRAQVDAHARVCPPCSARLVIEQSIHHLLSARRSELRKECASVALKERCGGFAGPKGRATDEQPHAARGVGGALGSRTFWSARFRPLALAASLVLVVGAAFLFVLTDRSSRVMAAELVADHVKCFGINHLLNTQQQASIVEGVMASSFGWHVRLPERPQQIGLELVGARPCLYGEGRIAHIMYRHNGHPLSVFMLPRSARPSSIVDVMGHEAAIWSAGDRTFVLVASEPRDEVARVASFIHASLR